MKRNFAYFLLGLLPLPLLAQVQPPAVPLFSEQTPPPAPDYALPSSWAATPAALGAAALVPEGASKAAKRPDVDVFYVYPTTFRNREKWNADVVDQETNHWTDISVIARQASVFSACCRIFAPLYRQASIASVYAPTEGPKAYDLAFSDVARAFDYYLTHENRGRPFILAGHSQGALMTKRLLLEKVRNSPAAKQLVAAYIIGIGISEGDFQYDFKGFQPCVKPNDTGCVLSWNSFLKGSDTAAYRIRSEQPFRQAHGEQGAQLLCHNPIALGGRERTAGALPGEPIEGGLQPLVPNSVSAECVDGILVVNPDPSLQLEPLPGGNMHYRDFSAYYQDIRADALRRARAFRGRHYR